MFGLTAAAHEATNETRVIVLRGNGAGDDEFYRISRWCHRLDDPPLKAKVRRDSSPTDIDRALATVREDRAHTVLLTIGIAPDQVLRALRTPDDLTLEIVIHAPESFAHTHPSASLFRPGLQTCSGDPIPHLRKSLLRLIARSSVTVRRLSQPAEFRQYFELRHRVWTAMNYLSQDRRGRIPWELDFADQTAIPIGAFSHQGELLGCVRVVHEMGRQAPAVATIQRLINEADDPKLRSNFAYRREITHPFDVLASIPGFARYYASLVRKGYAKAEISRVIVDPTVQGQGLGEVLVDSAISIADEGAIDVLFLACVKEHERFYSRSGFRKLEGRDMQCERFIGVEQPAIVMSRALRKGIADA